MIERHDPGQEQPLNPADIPDPADIWDNLRARRATQLRLEGHTLDAIKNGLQYRTRREVAYDIERFNQQENKDTVARYFQAQLARLQELYDDVEQARSGAAETGIAGAELLAKILPVELKVMEREAKLLGLDKQPEQGSGTGDVIVQFSGTLAEKLDPFAVEENRGDN